MNIEEKKAIEWLKEQIDFWNRNRIKNTREHIILNLIEKQQAEIENLKEEEMLDKADIEEIFRLREENEKAEKVIDAMAEKLVEAHGWFYSEFDNYTKEDWKEYFYKKAQK